MAGLSKPGRINSSPPSVVYVRQWTGSTIGIGSDNGLSPIRCQAIIETNAGVLSIRSLWTNISEILIKTQKFSFRKMPLKLSSAKCGHFVQGEMS